VSVEVKFFASLKEAAGCDAIRLELNSSSCELPELIAMLKARLSSAAFTALTAESVRVALNQELQNGPFIITSGDEVAFLPPVTGG
jgi:sulfur-carrier protein